MATVHYLDPTDDLQGLIDTLSAAEPNKVRGDTIELEGGVYGSIQMTNTEDLTIRCPTDDAYLDGGDQLSLLAADDAMLLTDCKRIVLDGIIVCNGRFPFRLIDCEDVTLSVIVYTDPWPRDPAELGPGGTPYLYKSNHHIIVETLDLLGLLGDFFCFP